MNAPSCCPYVDLSGLTCPRHTHHSEILYVVILVIKSAIYTLYVVFVLIWLHLAFNVFNSVSRIFHGGKL
jgi:hypothetical protein